MNIYFSFLTFVGTKSLIMEEEKTCKITRWQILKTKLNNLTPEEFRNGIINTPAAILIDVRTRAEYEQKSLPEAINIDYLAYDFWDILEKIDPNSPCFVFCRSGRRSIRACTLMKNGGFTKIYNLDGGLKVWNETFGELEIGSDLR